MKKFLMLFVVVALPLFAVVDPLAQAAPFVPIAVPSPPDIAAKSYIMIDADSGHVLVEHNADERLPPASLTKLMTAYILTLELERGDVHFSDMTTVSKQAWSQNPEYKGASVMFLRAGTKVSLYDLFQGLIVSSGCDAATAIAQYIAGSSDAFVDLMNREAKILGMTNTHFINPHGLPNSNPDSTARDLTTARDLSKLVRAILKYPKEYAIYKEKEFTYDDITQRNRNGLLELDPSVDGLKTGHTEAAGYCLVASAKRHGMRLITVVLGTDSSHMREQTSEKLLSYGFRYFRTRKVYHAGAEVAHPRVWGGDSETVKLGVPKDVWLTYARGKRNDIKAVMHVDKYPHAPIAAGQKVGEIVVSLGSKTLYKGPLVALDAVHNGGFFHRMWDAVILFFTKLLSH